MKLLLGLERRLQNLERAIQNMERNGEIVDVKFDEEKKRWFVKINDGDDTTPSGQDSSHQSAQDTFKSDWLPWKSFAHGTIKMSIPPRKGMKATMRSPGGQSEMACAEPFTYGPDTKSPHNKQDEVVMTVEGENGQEVMRIHVDKNNVKITRGKTTFHLTDDAITAETETYKIKTKSYDVEADTYTARTGSVTWSKK